MMIFGIAVSSLMALFPVSLRQGNQAVSDSIVTTFGDAVMNALAGKASSMQSAKDWTKWKNEATFRNEVVKGLTGYNGGENLSANGNDHTIKEYLGLKDVTIKYRLEIAPVNKTLFGDGLYRAILYATDNRYAELDPSKSNFAAAIFVTYMVYMGEVE